MSDNLTKNEIIEIYEYCIGGYNVPFETMKKQVKFFLKKNRGNLNELIAELKQSEIKELKLTGFHDH